MNAPSDLADRRRGDQAGSGQHAVFCSGICRSPAACQSTRHEVRATGGGEPVTVAAWAERRAGQSVAVVGGTAYTLTELQGLEFEVHRQVEALRLDTHATTDQAGPVNTRAP